MKSITLLILATGILAIGFLCGCNSDKDNFQAATISFSTNAVADTIYTSDSDTIKGTVVSEGPIKSVKFYRSFIFNNKEDSVEMAGTQITQIKGDTCNFVLPVIDFQYTTTNIYVIVNQVNGNKSTAKYTIISKIKTILNGWTGGWDSPSYGDFYSISNKCAYWYNIPWKSPATVLLCDFYFGSNQVGAYDLYYAKYGSAPWVKDMGTRFAKTDFTAAQFDAMKDDSKFVTLADPTLTVVDFKTGSVILFKTKDGKLGLLKIKSANSEEDYNIDIKVQR